MKNVLTLILLIFSLSLFAQEMSVTGRVVDEDQKGVSFATVFISFIDGSGPYKAVTTDEDGSFEFEGLPEYNYQIDVSMTGFKGTSFRFELKDDFTVPDLVIETGWEELDEVTVTATKPVIEKAPGKLTFIVENTALATGSAVELLSKTPGVLMITEKVLVKNQPATVYINGKRLYLSEGQVFDYLRAMDASMIKAVEVVTNPSARFDAEAGMVLNIQTTQAVSVGYKGSVGGTYEQAIYSKYRLNTSHFYKNEWLDLYGSYSLGLRKENKDQDDFVQFFDSYIPSDQWETDFNRVTRLNSHQLNLVADIKIDEKQSVSASANMFLLPSKEYENVSKTSVYNVQRQLDSTFTALGFLDNNQHNLSFALGYDLDLSDDGDRLEVDGNYINYKDEQGQQVATDYLDPIGTLLRSTAFNTEADQNTSIYTAEAIYSNPNKSGAFQMGAKYSNIDTESSLWFFDADATPPELDLSLSDEFEYSEHIYAGYASYEHSWKKASLEVGLRVEHTDVEGVSLSLGQTNSRNYTELFPSLSFTHELENDESISISYTRRIQRPRYQSLNPFKYFLNDFNFNAGNPNLVPAITNRVTVGYTIKDRWFFDLYYEHTKNPLSILTFQDNDTRTLRYLDVNLIEDYQYSLDLTYFQRFTPWWYFSTYSSGFYLQNEFFAVESRRETYSNKTWGFYNQIYNSFNVARSWSVDLTSVYFSNYIYGSYTMKNQYSLSLAVQKEIWDKRGRITLGVDDIFNTNNIRWTTRYYNQDNSYFPQPESRMFRLSFKYDFGNTGLSTNNRSNTSKEADRLDSN